MIADRQTKALGVLRRFTLFFKAVGLVYQFKLMMLVHALHFHRKKAIVYGVASSLIAFILILTILDSGSSQTLFLRYQAIFNGAVGIIIAAFLAPIVQSDQKLLSGYLSSRQLIALRALQNLTIGLFAVAIVQGMLTVLKLTDLYTSLYSFALSSASVFLAFIRPSTLQTSRASKKVGRLNLLAKNPRWIESRIFAACCLNLILLIRKPSNCLKIDNLCLLAVNSLLLVGAPISSGFESLPLLIVTFMIFLNRVIDKNVAELAQLGLLAGRPLRLFVLADTIVWLGFVYLHLLILSLGMVILNCFNVALIFLLALLLPLILFYIVAIKMIYPHSKTLRYLSLLGSIAQPLLIFYFLHLFVRRIRHD